MYLNVSVNKAYFTLTGIQKEFEAYTQFVLEIYHTRLLKFQIKQLRKNANPNLKKHQL